MKTATQSAAERMAREYAREIVIESATIGCVSLTEPQIKFQEMLVYDGATVGLEWLLNRAKELSRSDPEMSAENLIYELELSTFGTVGKARTPQECSRYLALSLVGLELRKLIGRLGSLLTLLSRINRKQGTNSSNYDTSKDRS